MSKKTNEEINRIITEKLFGMKVIRPSEYAKGLKGKNADYWRKRIQDNFYYGDELIYVKNNKPLKTHSIDAHPLPNFCENDSYIREARGKIEEKGLGEQFIEQLLIEIDSWEGSDNYPYADFEIARIIALRCMNASPLDQARAIVRVLEGE